MIAALKTGDSVAVLTLRMLISAVKNVAIARYGADADQKVTDTDVVDVVKKQVKMHRESIEAFAKGNRQDLVDKEKAELVILEAYLPKELSDEELKTLLEPIVSSGETNFGLLMKQAMETIKDQADGGRVAAILKQIVQ